MQTFKKREEIPLEFRWDLESIFSQNEDWERNFQAIQGRIPELEALQGKLAQSGEALVAVLRKRDELFEDVETLYVYASMR
ncbi:MAG TPA: oligoendopeptidase F, partial [Ktedonobacteraceae bacterium]|nr:oligoendopeptidase F [Ktedonobacteraceae bacterium]